MWIPRAEDKSVIGQKINILIYIKDISLFWEGQNFLYMQIGSFNAVGQCVYMDIKNIISSKSELSIKQQHRDGIMAIIE